MVVVEGRSGDPTVEEGEDGLGGGSFRRDAGGGRRGERDASWWGKTPADGLRRPPAACFSCTVSCSTSLAGNGGPLAWEGEGGSAEASFSSAVGTGGGISEAGNAVSDEMGTASRV